MSANGCMTPINQVTTASKDQMQTESSLPVEESVVPTLDVPKPKKRAEKSEKSEKSEKPEKSKKPVKVQANGTTTDRQAKPKRGPARPHRRLATEVIDLRIAKLQKRLDRAKSQIEDAGRHVEGYLRERDFRDKDAEATGAAPPAEST